MWVQICWTESRRAAVVSVRAKVLWFPGTCLWRVQSMFDKGISAMVGQPGAVSVLQENCNQGSIGRGKCICKLVHHTPDYSLNKHWKDFLRSLRPSTSVVHLHGHTWIICCVWERKRERGKKWGSRWKISGEWWMSVMHAPVHVTCILPQWSFFTSLRTCLPE